MNQLTLSQLCYLQSLPEELIEREYIRMLMHPSSTIIYLIEKLRKNLESLDMTIEENKLSGTNCVVKFTKPKIGTTSFSILHIRNSYEIALIGKKGIIYKPELGFGENLPQFDTSEEVIKIIQKTFDKLCELQTEYNRKKRQRRKLKGNCRSN